MTDKEVEDLKDGLSDYIENVLENLPQEYRSSVAYFMSLHCAIFGSSNIQEGLGILELAKFSLVDEYKEVIAEEIDNEQ